MCPQIASSKGTAGRPVALPVPAGTNPRLVVISQQDSPAGLNLSILLIFVLILVVPEVRCIYPVIILLAKLKGFFHQCPDEFD